MGAIIMNNLDIAEILIKNGANAEVKNNKGQSIFELIKSREMEILLKKLKA